MLITFVIHVSTATARRNYMNQHLAGKNITPHYILDGDKDKLEDELLSEFFKGKMKTKSAETSCAYKHLLAYQQFLKTDNEIALILEDDVYLHKKYDSNIQIILEEINHRKLSNFMISLEDSDLRLVPKSERISGQHIYSTKFGTTTAAYLIDRDCAKSILDYAQSQKIETPIDWFHTSCIENGIFLMYKSHPPIASQKTFDGSTPSLISNNRVGIKRIITYKLQRIYKKILYEFR